MYKLNIALKQIIVVVFRYCLKGKYYEFNIAIYNSSVKTNKIIVIINVNYK